MSPLKMLLSGSGLWDLRCLNVNEQQGKTSKWALLATKALEVWQKNKKVIKKQDLFSVMDYTFHAGFKSMLVDFHIVQTGTLMTAWEVQESIFKTCCMTSGNEKKYAGCKLMGWSMQKPAVWPFKMENGAAADQPQVCMVSLQQTVSLRALSDR